MPSLTKVQTGFLEPQGAFELTPGTSSSPGLFFTGDTSTGMFSPSAGVLGFSTGSTQNALTILADGNVGVGIVNPGATLEIAQNGSGSNTVARFRRNNNFDQHILDITVNPDTDTVKLISTGSANGSIILGTLAVDALTTTNSGNVGIGTTNPTTQLQIYSETNDFPTLSSRWTASGYNCQLELRNYPGNLNNENSPQFKFVHKFGDDLDNGFIGFHRGASLEGGFLSFGSFGVERVRIDPTGNVGIGTTNPTAKLHISGSTWNNTTGGDVVISNSSTVGSSITLRPTNSTSFSNGWSLYAGASGAAIGDGSFGFWNHTISERPFYVTQSNDAVIQNGNLIFNTAGRGIDFSVTTNPAGMTSELLNDYETGTFTPVWESTGTLPTLSYSTQSGYYVKIGRVVHIWIRIYMGSWGGGGGSGNIRVGGLPFTSNSDGNHANAGMFHIITSYVSGTNATWPNGITQIMGRLPQNSTSIEWIGLGNPSTVLLGENAPLQWSSNPQMYNNYITGSYFVA